MSNVRFGCSVVALAVLAIVVFAAMFSGGGDDAKATRTPAPTKKTTVEVRYRITTQGRSEGVEGRGNITYANGQGGTEQATVGSFDRAYTMRGGQHAYLSVQNDINTGGVICEITVDGIPWKRSESWGAFKIATCSGTIGR